jgi:hypothetical protein
MILRLSLRIWEEVMMASYAKTKMMLRISGIFTLYLKPGALNFTIVVLKEQP